MGKLALRDDYFDLLLGDVTSGPVIAAVRERRARRRPRAGSMTEARQPRSRSITAQRPQPQRRSPHLARA